MDRVALFCCRGFLRGDGDTKELYNTLGLESKRASTDEIKRAYKKKSLSLHPDKLKQRGIASTEETTEQFLKVKQAYEILTDPKRRKIYDQVLYSIMASIAIRIINYTLLCILFCSVLNYRLA